MIEKVSLYKFTHTSLLKTDNQLKQKSDKQPKKKITQFIKNWKSCPKTKSCLVKKKKNWTNCPYANAQGHFR